jgi:hypothetical protein
LFVSLVVRIALSNRESIGRLLAAVGDEAERGLGNSDEVPKEFAGCVDGSKCAFPLVRKEFLRGVMSLDARRAAKSFSSWATLSLRFILA